VRKHIDIQFEDNLSVPKYRQIIEAIQQKIKAGELKKGDKILSRIVFLGRKYHYISSLCLMFYLRSSNGSQMEERRV